MINGEYMGIKYQKIQVLVMGILFYFFRFLYLMCKIRSLVWRFFQFFLNLKVLTLFEVFFKQGISDIFE